MKRAGTILALFGAVLAAGGVGYLAWVSAAPSRTPGTAREGPQEPRSAAGVARAPSRAETAATRTPGASTVKPAPGATPATPAGKGPTAGDPAPTDRALRAPANDPTKAAAPTDDMSREEILARIAAGEKGLEVLASRLPEETAPVAPAWAEGQEWVVETYYRQMQASSEVWSGPALWRFRIAREVSFRDRPCYEIVVTREGSDDGIAPSTFYVTRGEVRLAGVRTTTTQNGKTQDVTWAPDADEAGTGVKAPLTIVPFDLPPVNAPARVTPPGLDVLPPEIPGAGQARMPKGRDLLGAGAPMLDLAYENPIDGTLVHQRWSREDMRWPVVSRTETTWSFRRRRA